ncbi:MAG: DUF5668 domain-containing protein [Caldilineaceae bacterium]
MYSYGTMSQPAKPEKSKSSMFGPIVLVALGILLLLSNLDVINLNFWELLFRFWPVFLIGAGLDILLGRRAQGGPLIVLMLILGLIFGAIWLGYVDSTTPFGAVHGESVVQPLNGASSAEVIIASSVSQMRLGAATELDALVSGNVTLHPNEELNRDFTVDGGTAHYTLESGSRSVILPSFGRSEDGLWDLQVNRAVPTNLSVSTGVGTAQLDLHQLTLTGLKVEAGVGKVEVTFPASGNFAAEINGGVGGIMLHIPDTLAVQIEASSGIGSVRIDNAYDRDGNIYTSPGYETATNRVDLKVTGGIGALSVDQITEE